MPAREEVFIRNLVFGFARLVVDYTPVFFVNVNAVDFTLQTITRMAFGVYRVSGQNSAFTEPYFFVQRLEVRSGEFSEEFNA